MIKFSGVVLHFVDDGLSILQYADVHHDLDKTKTLSNFYVHFRNIWAENQFW